MTNIEQQGEDRFRRVLKLMVLIQCTLEQMDNIKSVPHLYRQDIKKSLNNLETKLERYINPLVNNAIPQQEEGIFMQIQRGVESIINMTLEDIHNFNIEKDEERTDS